MTRWIDNLATTRRGCTCFLSSVLHIPVWVWVWVLVSGRKVDVQYDSHLASVNDCGASPTVKVRQWCHAHAVVNKGERGSSLTLNRN